MKVLLISREFPYPPHDGNVLPIYHFLRCLAVKTEITLLTLRPASDQHWQEGSQLFQSWGVAVEAVVAQPKTRLRRAVECVRGGRYWVNRFYEREFAMACARSINGGAWDIIHAEGILSAQHLPFLSENLQKDPPRILIARDCLSLAHQRAAEATGSFREKLQAIKIASMERRLFADSDCVMAISEIDRAAMQTIAPAARIELLPNGTDLKAFHPLPEREQTEVVMFTGVMDFAPNKDAVLHFAGNVWPQIKAERPQARFVVAGRRVPPEIHSLASQPGIEIRGEVASMPETLAEASVVVVPLRWGTGMKNKVLEGAAMARAMVVSPIALEGIALEHGIHLLVASEDQAFARCVVQLLSDPSRRQTLGHAARDAVASHYSWDAMAEKLLAIYVEFALEA